MEGNSERMGTFGDWGRAAGQMVMRGDLGVSSGWRLQWLLTFYTYSFSKEYSYIQCHLSFHILRSLTTPAKVIREIKGIYSLMGQFQTNTYCCSGCLLWCGVRPAPVPEQKGGIARPRHNVAVPTNVRLRPGQASPRPSGQIQSELASLQHRNGRSNQWLFFFKRWQKQLYFTRFVESDSTDLQTYKVIQI